MDRHDAGQTAKLSESDLGPIERKDQLQILLEEYKTLRAEILQLNTASSQIYGAAGTAFVAIAVLITREPVLGFFVLLLFPLVVHFAIKTFWFNIGEVATHMLELEKKINQLAGIELLTWETKMGAFWPDSLKRRRAYLYRPLLSARDRLVARTRNLVTKIRNWTRAGRTVRD